MSVHDLLPNRYEKKYEEIDNKIISIAMSLFLKQGFNATTMEQISDEVDIARKTLYNHFPVKEAIINEYVQRKIKEQEPEMRNLLQGMPDARSRLISFLIKQWEWVKNELNKEMLEEYYDYYRMQLALKSNKGQSHRNVFSGVLKDIIRSGQEAGEIRQDISWEELSNHLGWIHASALIAWLDAPDKDQIADSIKLVVDLFLNGANSRNS